jgi:hypothetical protein
VWCGAHSYASSTHLLITSQVDSSLLEYEHEALALDVGSLESSAGRGALIVQARLPRHSTSTAEYQTLTPLPQSARTNGADRMCACALRLTVWLCAGAQPVWQELLRFDRRRNDARGARREAASSRRECALRCAAVTL